MTNLTFLEKVRRLRRRLHDPEWRRYGAILFTGKATAIAIICMMVMFQNPGLLGMRTFAADPALKGNDIVRRFRPHRYFRFRP